MIFFKTLRKIRVFFFKNEMIALFTKRQDKFDKHIGIQFGKEPLFKLVGIYRNCHIDLSKELDSCLKTNRAIRVRNELISFAEQLSLNAREGERLLGSSEIIESVIGKFKRLEQDQSKSGFTAMTLSLASMLSKTTQDVIHKGN